MEKLEVWDMWKYLAATLPSHNTGLSLEKTIQMLEARGASAPSLERIRQITPNIKAFSAMGRGRTGDINWNAQRDKNVQLEPFGNKAFAFSYKIVLQSNHCILTLDDDLCDNQVNLLSNIKADKELHCADTLAEPFTRLSLYITFLRREQTQEDNVYALFPMIFEK
jgi:hypothetical protein